jgi:3-oxoacyl-[acyl-carrier protein] reductase
VAGWQLSYRFFEAREHPVGRHPDLDAAILMLATPASAYMTGSVMTVDGGITLSTI